jgi:hypothetical protein
MPCHINIPAIADGVPPLGCEVLDVSSVMATIYGTSVVDDPIEFIADTTPTSVPDYEGKKYSTEITTTTDPLTHRSPIGS